MVECEDNENEVELQQLCKEANMPIEDILSKYKDKIIQKSLELNETNNCGEELPGSSGGSQTSDSSTTGMF